jgi:NAD(P)-dependent dehydrogenase (short-subunit alcohol dehydrogenase family)
MTLSALVTGASRGIGLGIATRLAQHGFGLTVNARDADRLHAAAETLSQAGAPEVVTIAGDMAEPAVPATIVAAHAERFGSMNALIVNAGVGTAGPLADYPQQRFDKTIDINLRAPLLLVQHALPLLRAAAASNPHRGAKVMTLASITGVYAESNLAVYGATKAALISLTESLNLEEAVNGVTATAIAPGYVDTDMAAWVHDSIAPDAMIGVNDIVELVDALLQLSANAVVGQLIVSRAGTDGRRA